MALQASSQPDFISLPIPDCMPHAPRHVIALKLLRHGVFLTHPVNIKVQQLMDTEDTNFGHIATPAENEMKTIGIFPASGGLGESTYTHLLRLVPADTVILISRHPDKIPREHVQAGVQTRQADYTQSSSELEAAFAGIDVLFLISYPSHQHELRTKVRRRAPPSPEPPHSLTTRTLLIHANPAPTPRHRRRPPRRHIPHHLQLARLRQRPLRPPINHLRRRGHGRPPRQRSPPRFARRILLLLP